MGVVAELDEFAKNLAEKHRGLDTVRLAKQAHEAASIGRSAHCPCFVERCHGVLKPRVRLVARVNKASFVPNKKGFIERAKAGDTSLAPPSRHPRP